MKIVGALLIELKDIKNLKESKKISLSSVGEIINKIYEELELINNSINYYKTIYFQSWRSIGCEQNIVKIEKFSKIFDKRFELLIKILSVNI